jgi:hypothetical protein
MLNRRNWSWKAVIAKSFGAVLERKPTQSGAKPCKKGRSAAIKRHQQDGQEPDRINAMTVFPTSIAVLPMLATAWLILPQPLSSLHEA